MRTDAFVSPVARMAALSMLAFSLTTGALLLQLDFARLSAPAGDRYVDPVRVANLARGMGWLKRALAPERATAPAPSPDCTSGQDADLFACRLERLNQRLALTDPPLHLNAGLPDTDAMPQVLAAMRWLLQVGGTPAQIGALLQRGESAATQSLADPFRLNGCVRLAAASQPCDAAGASQAAELPLHAEHLLNSVALYTGAARGQSPNLQLLRTAAGLETPVVQGRHVTLGLDARVQDMAQLTAACYSGDSAACRRCDWCASAAATDMFEQARARAMGILVLDARSGAIEAAASAYSGCYARQQRGERAGPDCPQLPNTRLPHPDRLGNQALEQTAKPGSITKIVIALGLQRAGLSALETAALPDILTHSRTLELIDITLCRKDGFDPACAQRRLAAVADTAAALGWKRDSDVLGADQVPGLHARRFSARLLSQPDGTRIASAAGSAPFTRAALQSCSRQHWRNCKGRHLVDLVAELFGTGESLASPIGVGNALLHLAASARLQGPVPQAHLVTTAQDDAGRSIAVRPALVPVLNFAQGLPVLQGLEATTTRGTARSACLAAAAALPGGLLPCLPAAREPGRTVMRIAGKTGTPVFSADQGESRSLPLAQWRGRCEALRQELAALTRGQPRWHAAANEAGKCNMLPTKWYAFLVSAPGSAGWDRVVVVLAERNWNRRTGLIDSPNDTGPNVAAEAGLSFVNALYHPGTHRVATGRTSPAPDRS